MIISFSLAAQCLAERGLKRKKKNSNTRIYEMQYAELGAFVILHLIKAGINYYQCFMANAKKNAKVTTKARGRQRIKSKTLFSRCY